MPKYDLLFTVCIHHTFYFDELFRDLHIILSAGTAGIMEKTGLLFKQDKNCINVYYDQENLEAIKMCINDTFEPLSFIFKAFSKDSSFLNYTEVDIFKENKILFFSNINAESIVASITKTGIVSGSDYSDINSPDISAALSWYDQNIKPHFIIAVYPVPDRNQIFNKQGDPVKNQYNIKFSTRKTFWKYIVIGKKTKEDLIISDKENRIIFSETDSPDLPSENKIKSFISNQPIAMKERSNCHFELKTEKSNTVIIKKLPSPSTDIIFKVEDSGTSPFLSEIFINI